MKPERLTVLVGAGASRAIGLPGTDDVLEHLLQKEDERVADGLSRGFPYPPTLRRITELLKRIHTTPNFEHLMHALEALIGLLHTDAFPSGRYKAIELLFTDGLSAVARELAPERRPPHLAATLFVRWLCELFEHASLMALSNQKWPEYASFWQELSQRFTLDVATLNYDTCLEQALSTLAHGFEPLPGTSAQRFNGLAFRRSAESRIMHLHGSIRFGRLDSRHIQGRLAYEDDTWNDLYFYHDPKEAAASRRGSSTTPPSQAGRESIIGPIITGLQKPDKVFLVEPYMSYNRTFADCLESCPRLLVVGYGFGDLYINALLQRMPRWHSSMRIAVIDWAQSMPGGETTRAVPSWIDTGILARWAGDDAHVGHLAARRVIDENPWTSPRRTVWLDAAGFLTRGDQLKDVVTFFTT